MAKEKLVADRPHHNTTYALFRRESQVCYECGHEDFTEDRVVELMRLAYQQGYSSGKRNGKRIKR